MFGYSSHTSYSSRRCDLHGAGLKAAALGACASADGRGNVHAVTAETHRRRPHGLPTHRRALRPRPGRGAA